ncbi:hypothetical protein SAMN06265365_107125 [Tistlia consotensis]|uniref:Pirin N-terminal domain-containing protein n=1 Tax=Tistlia consotensis USBA 355 TaxID=560819 RepID=A0A1Y6BDG7_9PROT|nr:pirin-like bicupin family protein [Tistlia consotensis]SME97954.1 hypothetical protein SAMN05428998_102127 [Tistlia consotensis USBA 355]SNR57336.1 hypothetical protein SAMN06265365_107125 [Tistlia consotensis]
MIDLRPFESLGRFDNDWLAARYHFSFAGYHDPRRSGVGPLLVWNDDTIEPQTGFDLHGHRDMEIITYVRKGAISHRDHLGNEGRTEAGDVQVMSAGKGIMHAEFNLESEPTQIYQIWIRPEVAGATPRWDARRFPKAERAGELVALASGRKGHEAALPINADAAVLGATLKRGQSVEHRLGADRQAYLVAALGTVTVTDAEGDSVTLGTRDGAVLRQTEGVTVTADEDAEIVIADVRA